jgi:hypothetical protein
VSEGRKQIAIAAGRLVDDCPDHCHPSHGRGARGICCRARVFGSRRACGERRRRMDNATSARTHFS